MNDLLFFFNHKDYLFSIAYRITGSYQDSEDILQETYLRYQKLKLGEISNLRAYLGRISAHLAFDLLRKATRRKETYLGPYLPEPIPETHERANDDQIDFAFLVMLESLNPIERAVYILREAFEFKYEWISEIVGKNPENCRQVLRRAKATLKIRITKFSPPTQVRSKLLDEFLFACYTKDVTKLSNLLREDIISYSDGGGKVHAARIPITGLLRTAKFLIKTSAEAGKVDAIFFTYVSGKKAIVGYRKKLPVFLQYLHLVGGQVQAVYTVLNPNKLQAFANQEKLLQAGLLHRLHFFHFLKLFAIRYASFLFFQRSLF